MGEVWGAAVGAAITSYAASKKAKQQRKWDKEDRKEMTRDEAKYSAVLSRFEAEQEDYYNQLNRKRKQRGLDQFRQFSTVNQFAPQYVGDNTEIVLPDRPNINKIIDEVESQQAPAQRPAIELPLFGTVIKKGP